MHMRHIVICDLSVSTVFVRIISQKARFSEKKVFDYNMCVLIFPKNFVLNISYSKNNHQLTSVFM
jgi:hypothetical protein